MRTYFYADGAKLKKGKTKDPREGNNTWKEVPEQ